jgi:DtxR family Mn-dependent transcriptional regulator
MSEKQERIMPDEGVSLKQGMFEDEALEVIWEIRERHDAVTYSELIEEVENEKRLGRMQERGFVRIEDGTVTLTPPGEVRARDITRRHRLAERLFADVLDMKDFEKDACRIEHAISPEVEEAICTLLGHPPTCPHGKPIPRGECCALYTRKVKPLVQSLRDIEVGRSAKVLFINAPTMDRLAAMGLVPGADVRLNQRKPSFVIDIEETTIALDEDIAKGVYVKYI